MNESDILKTELRKCVEQIHEMCEVFSKTPTGSGLLAGLERNVWIPKAKMSLAKAEMVEKQAALILEKLAAQPIVATDTLRAVPCGRG